MTRAQVKDWLELLEYGCTQVSTTCLDVIIDQAGRNEPILPGVLSVEPPLPWQSLFDGLPEEGAVEVAPLMIRVDFSQPLQRQWLVGLTHELQGQDQLLVLASLWPFQALAEHLGQCLEARHGRRTGLLRFYDPRVFPLLFSHVLTPDQQAPLLLPAVLWSWQDRDGKAQCLPGVAGLPLDDMQSLPLLLSDDQIQALSCCSEATLAIATAEEALFGGCSPEQRFQACYGVLLEACQAGLLLATERTAYLLDRAGSACSRADFAKQRSPTCLSEERTCPF